MSKFAIVRNSIFVAAAVAASVPAFAGTVDSRPTMAVSYADLDLSTAQGQDRLHHRLTSAAHAVCADTGEIGSKIQTARSACIKQAMSRADTEFAVLVSKSQPQIAVADRTAR